jgi:hypothetical protein
MGISDYASRRCSPGQTVFPQPIHKHPNAVQPPTNALPFALAEIYLPELHLLTSSVPLPESYINHKSPFWTEENIEFSAWRMIKCNFDVYSTLKTTFGWGGIDLRQLCFKTAIYFFHS